MKIISTAEVKMTSSTQEPVPMWADPAVPDGDLDPQGVSRRRLLRRAGLYGAGFAVAAGGAAVGSPKACFIRRS